MIEAEPWHIGEVGQEIPMPNILKDWDPLTDIPFSRTITLDFPRIFQACGLSEGAVITVSASWHSPGTGLKELASSLSFKHGAIRQPAGLAFRTEGVRLAGSVALSTRVTLKQQGRHDSGLAASRIGSILWHEESTIQVEGLGARFPMEFADFSEHGFPTNAGWRLYWRKDFHSQAMGSLCLLINRQHERLRGIVSNALHDSQSPTILESIHFAVARDLIVGGIESDDFVEEPGSFPKGSIGEAIQLLIRRTFGNETPDAVRQLYRTDPERFECQLQHALKLFHQTLGAK